MFFHFIMQPPYALMIGLEALGSPQESGETNIDGVAIHLLLFSLEIRRVM